MGSTVGSLWWGNKYWIWWWWMPPPYWMWILEHKHYFFHCIQQTNNELVGQWKKSLLSANFRDRIMSVVRIFYRAKSSKLREIVLAMLWLCKYTKSSWMYTYLMCCMIVVCKIWRIVSIMEYNGWYKQALLFLLNIAF